MSRVCPPCHHDCGQGDFCPAHSLNTRRYSRTLVEAFGPHTSLQIEEPRPIDREDRIVMYACAATALAVLFLVLFA